MSRHRDVANKIYVGDLPRDASEKELERHFSYYGRLRNVWVARNPAGFAFVEYEDHRDAEDAVRGLDGTTMCGVRVRVEHSSGKVRPKPWLRGGYRGGGGGGRGGGRDGGRDGSQSSRGPRKNFNPDDRCYECNGRGHYAYDCKQRKGLKMSTLDMRICETLHSCTSLLSTITGQSTFKLFVTCSAIFDSSLKIATPRLYHPHCRIKATNVASHHYFWKQNHPYGTEQTEHI